MNFTKFAEDLLTKAAQFDQANIDDAVDDNDATRTEVLRAFTEQWLEGKITPAAAARINVLTSYHHNIDADEIAPELQTLLAPG